MQQLAGLGTQILVAAHVAPPSDTPAMRGAISSQPDILEKAQVQVYAGNLVRAPYPAPRDLMRLHFGDRSAPEQDFAAGNGQIAGDRKSGVQGKSVSVRVGLGGRRIIK